MEPTTVLKDLETRLNNRPEILQGFEALYCLKLSGEGGGTHYLQIREGKAALLNGPDGVATATVSLAAKDFLALANRTTSGMSLFMEGKITIEGDMATALRLESLLRD